MGFRLAALAALASTCTAANTVVAGAARFTVLTDSLIRLEWAAAPLRFNDVPSLIFQERNTPEVAFTTKRSPTGGVVIATRHVT